MRKCYECKKYIWFWQKETRRLVGPDDIGEYYGKRFHKKCIKDDKNKR